MEELNVIRGGFINRDEFVETALKSQVQLVQFVCNLCNLCAICAICVQFVPFDGARIMMLLFANMLTIHICRFY